MVADSGENSIIVIAAANGTVDAQTVRAQAERIQDADVVVCQGEIPPDGIAEAARGAKRFVFNLAPVVDVDPEVIRMADPLVVNEHEAAWWLLLWDRRLLVLRMILTQLCASC